MMKAPIVEEVRTARQKIFEPCNEDLDTLRDRFQEREKLDRKRIVSGIPPRPGDNKERANGRRH